MKKQLLSVALIALSLSSYAQCPTVNCTHTQALNGNTTNGTFSTSVCFKGHGTIGTGANFSNWSFISFRDTIDCQKPLNMPVGKKILTKDTISLSYVSMSGSDTIIKQSGYLSITTLVSNNSTAGQYNILMLPYMNSSFTYNSIIYHPGDTIVTSANPTNNIYIIACSNTALSIDYINIERQSDYLIWEYDEPTYLLYSEDGISFSQSEGNYYSGLSRYKINKSGYYKVRSFDKQSKVLKVIYDQQERQKQVIYFYKSQFYKIRPVGVDNIGNKTLTN